MLITVRHVTRYIYAEPVNYTDPEPAADARAHSKASACSTGTCACPGAGSPLQFKDGFGNAVHLVTINARHDELVIEAGGTVETEDCNGVVAGLRQVHAAARLPEGDAADQARRRHPRRWRTPSEGKDPLERLHALLGRRPRSGRLRAGRHRRSHRAPPRRSPTARACARTTRTSSSPRRARSASRRATSRAIWCWRSERVGGAPRLGRGLGGEPGLGRASTSPTASAPPIATCASPPGSMRATRRPSSARAGAGPSEKLDVSVAVQQQSAQQ